MNFTEELRRQWTESGKSLNPEDIRPLALAYLGDTVFDLYIRSRLVMTTHLHPKEMHVSASGHVNAQSQARMVKLILPLLTEKETQVFKHARNQRPQTLPKNMSPVDYKLATGLEALLGYLFVTGQDDRLMELLNQAYSRFHGKEISNE